MSDKHPEGITLIGLHRIAAANGDGLIPELYALLAERERLASERPNVVDFPVWSARLPGEAPEHDLAVGNDDGDGENVIAFRRQPGDNPVKRKNG